MPDKKSFSSSESSVRFESVETGQMSAIRFSCRWSLFRRVSDSIGEISEMEFLPRLSECKLGRPEREVMSEIKLSFKWRFSR